MNRGPWIETFTGKKFHLLNPQPEEICIEDIAHALSNQGRFTGHTRKFLSVAEHSYNVSILCGSLYGLLHDGSESYLSDLSRPVKYHTAIGPIYKEIEAKIQGAICDRFGLPHEQPKEVTEADHVMLYTEKEQLMPNVPWEDENKQPGGGIEYQEKTARIVLACYRPEVIERIFLGRFNELQGNAVASGRI